MRSKVYRQPLKIFLYSPYKNGRFLCFTLDFHKIKMYIESIKKEICKITCISQVRLQDHLFKFFPKSKASGNTASRHIDSDG